MTRSNRPLKPTPATLKSPGYNRGTRIVAATIAVATITVATITVATLPTHPTGDRLDNRYG